MYVQGGKTLKARDFKMMLICLDWLEGYGARKGHKKAQEQKCMNAVGRKKTTKHSIKYTHLTSVERSEMINVLHGYMMPLMVSLVFNQICKQTAQNF